MKICYWFCDVVICLYNELLREVKLVYNKRELALETITVHNTRHYLWLTPYVIQLHHCYIDNNIVYNQVEKVTIMKTQKADRNE